MKEVMCVIYPKELAQQGIEAAKDLLDDALRTWDSNHERCINRIKHAIHILEYLKRNKQIDMIYGKGVKNSRQLTKNERISQQAGNAENNDGSYEGSKKE